MLPPTPESASPVTGQIDVVVTNSAGQRMAGVRVELSRTGQVLAELTTSDTGEVSFAKLAPGVYAVTASRPGFQDFRNGEILVNDGAVVRVFVNLTEPPPPAPLSPPQPPGPSPQPPSFLYLVVAGLVLLAGLLAWYLFKLRLRLADQGRSLFVSPAAAQEGALKGCRDYGLDARDDWKPHLWAAGARASALEPVLVQQIGSAEFGESFYYLVPIGKDLASVTAVVCVDGVTGEYQEASRFEGGKEQSWGRTLAAWRTPAATRATIIERKLDLHLGTGGPVHKDEIGVHPHLVWRACPESESPFLPFRMVKVGDAVRYIRIDGVVFDKLS